MNRVSESGATELTDSQCQILQAAIDKAIFSGIVFDDFDDMTEYLRADSVPEQLLADKYLKARANLWMRRVRPTAGATGRILTGTAALENPLSPSPPRLIEGEQPRWAQEEGLACGPGIEPGCGDSVAVLGDELLRWPTFLVSVSPDNGASWDGLSCRIYKTTGNFIRAERAAELQLPTVIGTKHELTCKLHIEGFDKKTRLCSFTVVEDNVLDPDVALGIEWLRQDKERRIEAVDVNVIDQDEERIDVEIRSCLSRQVRQIIQHMSSVRTPAEISKMMQLLDTLLKMQEKLVNRYDNQPVVPEILENTYADLVYMSRRAMDAMTPQMRNDPSAPQKVPALPSSQ